MNRQTTRTILILALIAWCLLPLFIGCKSDRPVKTRDTLSIDTTTDNDWIKDHSEIKKLDE